MSDETQKEFVAFLTEANDRDRNVRIAALKVSDALWAADEILKRRSRGADVDFRDVMCVAELVIGVAKDGSTAGEIKDVMTVIFDKLGQKTEADDEDEPWKRGEKPDEDLP